MACLGAVGVLASAVRLGAGPACLLAAGAGDTQGVQGEDVLEPLKPLRADGSIAVPLESGRPKSTYLQALLKPYPGALPDGWGTMGVPAKSVTNELCCLHNRVLMETPDFTPRGKSLFKSAAASVSAALLQLLDRGGGVRKWTWRKTMRHMIRRHGAGLYGPAAASLRVEPLNDMDCKISMFTKVEKLLVAPGGSLKTPRPIQYRGPRYNLVAARYLLAIEEKLYAALHVRNAARLYTSKGLTTQARADLLLKLWSCRSNPMALCVDASRFDAHVRVEHLKEEQAFYKALFPRDRLLAWLLAKQLHNRGIGAFGSRYSRAGGRMSGDVNTALGNTLIQLMVLKTLCGDVECDIIAEGDDAIIFGDVDSLTRLAGCITQRAETVGFSLKVSTARWPEELEYCSSRPIEVQSGDWVSVRGWPKPLLSDHLTARPVASERAKNEKARTMAVCFAHQYTGIPVYSALAKYQLSWAKPGKLDPWYDRHFWLQTLGASWSVRRPVIAAGMESVPASPSRIARDSFALAFDVSPSEQIGMERELLKNLGPHPCEILHEEDLVLKRAAAQLSA